MTEPSPAEKGLDAARAALLEAALPVVSFVEQRAAEGDTDAAEIVAPWRAAWDKFICAGIEYASTRGGS